MILSVQKCEFSLAHNVQTGSVNLTEGQDVANCVPFWSYAYDSTDNVEGVHTPDIVITAGSPGTCNVEVMDGGTKGGVLDLIVYVVEFDPAEVSVQVAAVSMVAVATKTVAISAVVLAQTFAVSTMMTADSALKRAWCHTTFNSTTEALVSRQNAGGADANGHLYVVEALNSQWDVQTFSISWDGTATLSAVDMARTFLQCGCLSNDLNDRNGNRRGLVDLTNTTTVTSATDSGLGEQEVRGFAVEFSGTGDGDGNVYRGNLSFPSTDVQEDATITSVDLARTSAHIVNSYTGNGTSPISGSTGWGRNFATLDLIAATTLRGDSLDASANAATVGWEVIEWPASAGGTSLPVGLATETDAALGLAAVKRAGAGLATETDAALALGGQKRAPAGLALEADTALGLSAEKRAAPGLATETDTALALAAGGSTEIAVGLATETDAALGLAAVKRTVVGLATETDDALGFTGAKHVAAAAAVEADAALGLTGAKHAPTGLALETDAALALGAQKLGAVGLATETDTALALSAEKRAAPGLALETDTALALLASEQRIAVGLATETDTALALELQAAQAPRVARLPRPAGVPLLVIEAQAPRFIVEGRAPRFIVEAPAPRFVTGLPAIADTAEVELVAGGNPMVSGGIQMIA